MAAEAQNKGKNTQEQLLASETLGTVEEGPQKKVAESKESETLSVKACSAGSLAPDSEMVTDFQKKMRRAERFGVAVKLSEQEKRNSRAERFGTGSSIHRSDESKKAEEQKRKARAERFGLPTQSVVDEEAKKKARLARFAPASKPDSVEEDKKKARAIRFSQDLSAVPSQANNGKTEDSLKETAIVSKAGGGA